MSIQLINGDCLEVMKDLSANSIDCFICDLPYGCLSKKELTFEPSSYGHGNRKVSACAWDIKIDLVEFWKQVERLAKNEHTPILMFCNTKFGYELIKSKEDWFRYDLVWNKERGVSFLSANKMPMKSHEMVYVFSKKGAYYNRVDIDEPGKKKEKGNVETLRCDNVYNTKLHRSTGADEGKRCVVSVINLKKVGTVKDKHPTEKPIELYKWLIERYCPPGGKLLDPTAGSCNSCFAGYELDRECIGIEMDSKFFQSAKKKVDEL
jgi:DNA modification methylase